MEIITVKPRGFCAGVDRAIDIVELALHIHGAPVFMKHQIVHNTYVVERLCAKGAIFVEDLSEIPDGSVTVLSAHGVPPSLRERAKVKNLQVIDATCPLVTRVHLEAIRYSREGYSILLVGHRGHVEMEGTMGEAPTVTQLVHDKEDAEHVQVPDPNRVVALSQTTLSIDDVAEIMQILQRRFPNLTTPPKGDICYATTNRQAAVKVLAEKVDVVLVVGSTTSSNANRLREVAERLGTQAYLVNGPDQVQQDWFANAKAIGITSGASTPEDVFQEVANRVKEMTKGEVKDLEALQEEVWFALPPDLVKTAKDKQVGNDVLDKHLIQANAKMKAA